MGVEFIRHRVGYAHDFGTANCQYNQMVCRKMNPHSRIMKEDKQWNRFVVIRAASSVSVNVVVDCSHPDGYLARTWFSKDFEIALR